ISEGLNEGRNSIAFIITDAAGNDIAQALISIVFDTDDTLTVDDDAPADFDNIQEAIEKATAGDTIQVVDGTYTEPIGTCDGNDAMFCVDKSLTITGDPGAQGETIDDAGPGLGASVINGGGAFASAFVIDNGVSNVTIEGFEIHNFANNPGAFTGGIGSAIFSWNTGATNITVQDNYLHNLGWNGVLVGSDNGTTQSEWTVKRNIIEAADYAGIELTNVISSEVAFNKVIIGDGISWDPDDSGVGIEVAVRDYGTTVTAGTGVSVHDNEIDGNAAPPERAGINILSRAYQAASNALLTGVSVENNTVTGAARGIYVVAEARNGGIAAVESLSITGNTFNGNGEGLVIFDLVDSSGTATHNGISVVNNDITNSTDGASGVHIETDTAATGITINNNNITSNLGFGVNNEGIGVLNATNNWWGDASGPMIDTNPGGLGDAVSTNVIYSPWCTAVPSGDPLDCPLGSNGPLFEFLLTFNPLSPITIPNATTLTVTAVDDIGITLVNETGEVELSGDGSTQFDGISGLAFKSFFDGVLTTELTKTTPGTVNIVAKDAGVKRGEAQITFEGITPEPFVVDEERVVSDTGVPTDLYTDGWRHTFFLTINATDETDLWVRFGRGENFSIPNWLNVSDGESNIPVTGNMRVLFNTVTGGDLPVRVGGLTEDDIIDGFSGVVSFEIGNSFNDQKVNGTSTAMNTAGLDTNLSASGRQIRFHIFTKIPEGTATGFYETGYEIRLGNE
ncbi:MAG: hypothetical protein Q8P35_01655, partial [Candidatus Yanofskybacteria bacterium]|nr:hypothetical protein [Candidatus Yanofskybacteria bacterium]